MIIWLASYPKSGNTWVKNIINQIVHHDFKNKEEVFENSSRIRRYPGRVDIEDLPEIPISGPETENQKKNIINHTIRNWKKSQKKINKNEKINFLKTHNMLCNINLNDKHYPFTDIENTIGVIHIVRDPRNIVASVNNHFSHKSQEQSLEMLLNKFNWTGLKNHDVPQLLSSWKNHYNSWKRFPKNNLLIKYEELLKNPHKKIEDMIVYLSTFLKIKITKNHINQIVENTSFENFKIQENKGKFDENATNDLGDKKKFFFLGPKNNWKNYLKEENLIKLTKEFDEEMRELGYL